MPPIEGADPLRLRDSAAGYGWVSIALHWITGCAVIVLLFVGSSIASDDPATMGRMLLLHTSIAVLSYVFLWARVIWRWRHGHPGPLPTQRGIAFLIGKYVHLTMLGAIPVMLISGPLMVWAGGNAIAVFDWFTIPSPIRPHEGLRGAAHAAHAAGALVIFAGTLLHLGGVYKHAAFNQDGTFGKMLIAAEGAEPRRETL
jgi:cytochrome b561